VERIEVGQDVEGRRRRRFGAGRKCVDLCENDGEEHGIEQNGQVGGETNERALGEGKDDEWCGLCRNRRMSCV
jgi:hypothetical protein